MPISNDDDPAAPAAHADSPAPAQKDVTSSPPRTGGAGQGGFADEADDEWRHAPVAPRDEKNPLKSIGEAIADVATGSEKAVNEARALGKPPRP
ncbi:MAG: hypothetical protein M3Z16_09980 [Pseudomonadota bacterium]|nr:hypothetical protein [Pseudomonadota bacterium]